MTPSAPDAMPARDGRMTPSAPGAAPATGAPVTRSAPGRLAGLAASLGEPSGGGDALLCLAGEDLAWFVERGGVDVFLVEYRDGTVVSSFKHLLRAGPGRLVFGIGEAAGEETAGGGRRAEKLRAGKRSAGKRSAEKRTAEKRTVKRQPAEKRAATRRTARRPDGEETLAAVARPLPGTALRRVRPSTLVESGAGDDVAGQVDAWISAVSAAVARDVELPPHPEKRLGRGEEVEAGSGCVLAADQGLVWATGTGVGTVEFIGAGQALPPGAAAIPLTLESWIRLDAPARLAGRSSRDLQAADEAAAGPGRVPPPGPRRRAVQPPPAARRRSQPADLPGQLAAAVTPRTRGDRAVRGARP